MSNDSRTIDLVPSQAFDLPSFAGQPPTELAVDDGTGVVVVSNSQQILVVGFQSRIGTPLQIAAKSRFSGFALTRDSLFVQDGPVLSRWDLPSRKRLAAVNLVTGEATGFAKDGVTAEAVLAVCGSPTPAAGDLPQYSAPVVRAHELGSVAVGMVFALSSTGTIYALDYSLSLKPREVSFEPPMAPMLALAEVPHSDNDAHDLDCRLFYPIAGGGIREIDASSIPLKALEKWSGQATGAGMLPLRFVGGRLWSAGMLGPELSALPLPAPTAGQSFPPPAGRWRDYEVSTDDHLVCASCNSLSTQLSFGASEHVARWGNRPVGAPVCSLFVPAAGDAAPDAPRFVIEVDAAAPAAGGSTGFRLLLSYAIHEPDPSLGFPAPVPLASGHLTSKAGVAGLRTRPVLVRDGLYAVVASGPGDPGSVVCYSLSSLLSSVADAAKLERAQVASYPNRVGLQFRLHTYHWKAAPHGSIGLAMWQSDDPIANHPLTLSIGGNPPISQHVYTDDNGQAWLDPSFSGKTATVTSIEDWPESSCKGCVLASRQVTKLVIESTVKER